MSPGTAPDAKPRPIDSDVGTDGRSEGTPEAIRDDIACCDNEFAGGRLVIAGSSSTWARLGGARRSADEPYVLKDGRWSPPRLKSALRLSKLCLVRALCPGLS